MSPRSRNFTTTSRSSTRNRHPTALRDRILLAAVALRRHGWMAVAGVALGALAVVLAFALIWTRGREVVSTSAGARERSTESGTVEPTPTARVLQDPRILVRPPTVEEVFRLVEEGLGRAVQNREDGEFAAAALEYRRVLALSPSDSRAREGLADCTVLESYFAPIRQAFSEEDFRTALSLLYRMPSDVAPGPIRRAQINGWYDLGLVGLRASRCEYARESFYEALALSPSNPGVKSALALAEACGRTHGSVAFRAEVEKRRFRGPAD